MNHKISHINIIYIQIKIKTTWFKDQRDFKAPRILHGEGSIRINRINPHIMSNSVDNFVLSQKNQEQLNGMMQYQILREPYFRFRIYNQIAFLVLI